MRCRSRSVVAAGHGDGVLGGRRRCIFLEDGLDLHVGTRHGELVVLDGHAAADDLPLLEVVALVGRGGQGDHRTGRSGGRSCGAGAFSVIADGDGVGGGGNNAVFPQRLDFGIPAHGVEISHLVLRAADLPSLELLIGGSGEAALGQDVICPCLDGHGIHAAAAGACVEGDRTIRKRRALTHRDLRIGAGKVVVIPRTAHEVISGRQVLNLDTGAGGVDSFALCTVFHRCIHASDFSVAAAHGGGRDTDQAVRRFLRGFADAPRCGHGVGAAVRPFAGLGCDANGVIARVCGGVAGDVHSSEIIAVHGRSMHRAVIGICSRYADVGLCGIGGHGRCVLLEDGLDRHIGVRHGELVVHDCHAAADDLPLLEVVALVWRCGQGDLRAGRSGGRSCGTSAVSVITDGDGVGGGGNNAVLPQCFDLNIPVHGVGISHLVLRAADLPSLELLIGGSGEAALGQDVICLCLDGHGIHAAAAAVAVEGDCAIRKLRTIAHGDHSIGAGKVVVILRIADEVIAGGQVINLRAAARRIVVFVCHTVFHLISHAADFAVAAAHGGGRDTDQAVRSFPRGFADAPRCGHGIGAAVHPFAGLGCDANGVIARVRAGVACDVHGGGIITAHGCGMLGAIVGVGSCDSDAGFGGIGRRRRCVLLEDSLDLHVVVRHEKLIVLDGHAAAHDLPLLEVVAGIGRSGQANLRACHGFVRRCGSRSVAVRADDLHVVPPVCSDCRRSLVSRVVSRDHGIFRSRVIVAAIWRGETIGGTGLRLAVDGHRLDAGGRLSRCSRVAHGEGVRAGISIDGILDGVALTVLQNLQHRRLRVRSHHIAAHSAELLLLAPVAGNVFGILFGHFRGGVSRAAFHTGPDVAAVPISPTQFMAACAFLAAQLQLADHSAVIVGIWQAQPLQVHAPIFVGDKKLRCGAPVLLIRFLVVAPLPPCRAQPHGLPVRGSDFDVLFYNHCKFLILHHCHVVRPVRASSDRGCRQLCITVVLIKRKGQRSQRCVLDQNVPAVAVHAAADARAQVALRPHHAASDGNVIARTASSATDSCAGIVTPSFDRSTGNLDMMRIFRLVLSVLIAAADSCSA